MFFFVAMVAFGAGLFAISNVILWGMDNVPSVKRRLKREYPKPVIEHAKEKYVNIGQLGLLIVVVACLVELF